ncbi:MAG: prephenate dehydrogenase/arogenate dehydrogenase family protein [Dehalococcoidia bacterium]|nr:MAG: prephenate dehydrogenase/arogenate dehydrogenase family protein [Dehalococcoidia bacterium]
MERVAIIGLGLIGGSIALAVKRANIPELQVVGTARTRETLQRAKKMGAIDLDAPTAAHAVRDARLVVIASPIMATRSIMEEIAPALAPGAVVTDVGSTKGNVARWAQELLPETVSFVGGHPMAGKEQAGIAAADPDLFKDKAWVIAPSVSASEAAVNTVVGLVQLTGASPVFMDPDEHDSYVAAISHLPLLLSSALFSVAHGSAAWPELAKLASSGFRDTTRLASGSPEMAHDIVLTNRDNVIHWLDRFIDELRRFRAIVAGGASEEVVEAFTKAQLERDNFLVNGPPQRDAGEPIPKISLGDMLLGSAVAGYMKKQQEIIKAAEARAEGKRK